MFEVVYIYVLVELINQKEKLKKSFVIIHLVYIIEEDEEEMKKKKRDEKEIYTVEDI